MKSGKHRRIALATFVTALAAVGAALYRHRDRVTDWWYGVPVVRTWSDLLARDPITLSNGQVVRFGIESSRVPQGSAVLVYCLADTPLVGDRETSSSSVNSLGPLDVIVSGDARSIERLEYLTEESGGVDWTPLLFVHPLPIERAGRSWIEIRSGGGAALARFPIRATQERVHPWVLLESRNVGLRDLQPFSAGTQRERARVGAPGPTIVIPSWRGREALGLNVVRRGLSDPKSLLPSWSTFDAPPDLALERDGAVFVLTPNQPLLRDGLEHFAARWWVRGTPWRPEKVEAEGAHEFVGRGGFVSTRPLAWEIPREFDWERLGAKPGDEVGLEIFYSDAGWTPPSSEFLSPLIDDSRLLRSDRVSWCVPAPDPTEGSAK